MLIKNEGPLTLDFTINDENIKISVRYLGTEFDTFELKPNDIAALNDMIESSIYNFMENNQPCQLCRQRPAVRGYAACEECAKEPYDYTQDDQNYDAWRERK